MIPNPTTPNENHGVIYRGLGASKTPPWPSFEFSRLPGRTTRPMPKPSQRVARMNGHADHEAPRYGQRLPLRIIDERAQKEPSREWLSIPRTSDPADGWEKITYGQAAKAINRVGHKITAAAGKSTPGKFPTIAYIGPNDTRYLAFMYGAVKAGYKVSSGLWSKEQSSICRRL